MAVFKATKRSIIKARASTEQAISGQIGQPAACMIDSKWFSRIRKMAVGDYGLLMEAAAATAGPAGSIGALA